MEEVKLHNDQLHEPDLEALLLEHPARLEEKTRLWVRRMLRQTIPRCAFPFQLLQSTSMLERIQILMQSIRQQPPPCQA